MDYVVSHAPFAKLVRKTLGRMALQVMTAMAVAAVGTLGAWL